MRYSLSMGSQSAIREFVVKQGVRGVAVSLVVGQIFPLVLSSNQIWASSTGFVFIFANCLGIIPVALVSGFTAIAISRSALFLKDLDGWNLSKLGAAISMLVVAPLIFLFGSNNSGFSLPFAPFYALAIPLFVIGSVIVSARSSQQIPEHLRTMVLSTRGLNLIFLVVSIGLGVVAARSVLPWETYETHQMTWRIEFPANTVWCKRPVVLSFVASPTRSIEVCSTTLISFLEENAKDVVVMEIVAWNEDFYRYYSLERIDDWRPGLDVIVFGDYCYEDDCPGSPINEDYYWRQQ